MMNLVHLCTALTLATAGLADVTHAATLYRVEVKALGPLFEAIDQFFSEWIGEVDQQATSFALDQPISPHRAACFNVPDKAKYDSLEEKKKEIQRREPRMGTEEEMRAVHELFGAKRWKDGEGFSLDNLWSWRPAAHFSSRGSRKNRMSFRIKAWEMMRHALGDDFDGARASGTCRYGGGWGDRKRGRV